MEGAEPEVLEGVRGANVEKIVVVCGPERDGKSPISRVVEILKSMGYEIETDGKMVYAW